MNIIGIERVVYGVKDLAACSRYLADGGFVPAGPGDGHHARTNSPVGRKDRITTSNEKAMMSL